MYEIKAIYEIKEVKCALTVRCVHINWCKQTCILDADNQ